MNKRQDFHKKPDWNNISVTSINRTPAHVKWNPFTSIESAKSSESPYITCLNGEYEFMLYDNPDKTDDFFLPGYAGFTEKITVPGNWELQGHGEPIYTNVHMPWNPDLDEPCNIVPEKDRHSAPNPPFIPSANPTGCYRHTFVVPDNFNGRNIYIRFDGVEASFYLWINGKPVGYSEDSKLPCEFNITEFLMKGDNLLALQVMRFSSSTYLEDQDYWYLSGIYRSVWLVAKPKLCIMDYFIKAIPNLPFENGTFSVDVTVSRLNGFADCRVEAYVFDKNGTKLAKGESKPAREAQYRNDYVPTANTARINLNIPKVIMWSPECPTLYKAVLTLLSPDGEVLDVETCEFGFKLVEIKNGILYLNGKRLVICGVNRHEHNYKTGRTVSMPHMIDEIRHMKRMNINSVRTCHYPDMPEWYDLCDKYGILVVCECNLETHAVAGMLTHNPEYATDFLERAIRMVQTHKNHACIYSWSLGNESGTGANHAAMYGFVKEYDPTRLCQYEAGGPGKNISDIRGNMYAAIDHIMKMLTDTTDNRPIILVEYLYQICNSGGGMEHFRTLTETYERFQGGYIWDWQDKALEAKDDNGNVYFGYSGDFKETMTEYQHPLFMTNNGIIMPDLTWKPVAYEVKQIYAPVYFSKGRHENTYILHNKFHDSDLSGFRCVANLRENGMVVTSAEQALENLPPQSKKEIMVSLPYAYETEKEYHIDLNIYDSADYEVSSCQFTLKAGNPPIMAPVCELKMPILINEDNASYIITGTDFEYLFSKQTGNIIRFTKNGMDYLTSCGNLCFDRPISGLDASSQWGYYDEFSLIQRENIEIEITDMQTFLSPDASSAIVDTAYCFNVSTGEIISGGVRYRIVSDGTVYISFYINSTAYTKHLQRAGIELILPKGYDNLKYFAYGETENYCDRKSGVKLGVYESTIEKQHFPFAPPSENGGHEETRWLILKNNCGASLTIEGIRPFHFDTHNYTVSACREAKHDHEMIRCKETILHIDAAHSPIGSNMAWSTFMPEELAVKGGYYSLDFKMVFEKSNE